MLLKSANPLFFAFSLGLGGGLSAAGQTVIDDFHKGQTTLARAAAGTDSSTVSGAMLGGERDVAVTLSSGSSISAGVALGRFRFNQDAGVTGTAEIVWDGVDSNATSLNPTGLGGVDLTAGGQDAFLLGVNSLDQAATITFTVYSGTTASSSLILPLPGGVTSPNYVSIPFNTFAGSANFGSVGAIRLDISAPGDATLDLDFLRTTSTTFRPSVDATLTDVVLLDNDGNGRASAGDRLKYVVTIKNNSGSTLSNVVFNAPIPASATLVVGSVQSQPVARPDIYPNAVGNSLLTVNAANGVLVNDSDADGDTLSIAAFDATSAHGGTVTMSTANGSFTYLPPAGYTGSDTFAYSVSDGHGGAASATVTITISGMVWYVDNAAAPGGDGRSTRPFTSLSALQGAGAPDAPGDYIFVSQGSGPYTSGITLDDNQQLIGQGVDLVVNSQTLVTGSPVKRPTIENATGNGITLASGNTIRGLNVGDTPAGFGFAGGIAGVLNISECSKTGTGGALSITGSGTAGTVSFDALSSAGAPAEAINLVNVSGAITAASGAISAPVGTAVRISGGGGSLTYPGSITKDNAGRLVDITGKTGGSIVLSGSLSLTSASGTGINISTNTGGTIAFSGPGKVLNTSGNAAVTLLKNTGATINFSGGGLDIKTTTATAFSVTGGGTVNVTGGGNTVNTTAGPAFSNSGAGGSATISIDADLTSTTGRLVSIQSRTGNDVTLSGNLTNAGTGVLVQNNSGGTVTFSGASKSLSTAGNNAVTLSANNNTTISFTGGGLAISTTGGTGFSATAGAAAINVTGANNTISTTTGTALNVVGANIGAGGLNFRSVSSNGGSNTGIILFHTGSSGGLTVTGSGTAGSGGTIVNKTGFDGDTTTGNGIYLNNTVGVSLSHMQLNDFDNFAIRGISVTDFAMDNCVINGSNGNDATGSEGCIYFSNLLGISSMSNSTLSGGFTDNLRVINDTGANATLTIVGSTFQNNNASNGNDGILFEGQGVNSMAITVSGCAFSNHRGDHFQLSSSGGNPTMQATLTNNTFTGTAGNLGAGITISPSGDHQTTFNLLNNTITKAVSHAINVNLGTGGTTPTLSGTISGNVIGASGVADSGSSQGNGISVTSNGSGTLTVAVLNNNIRQYANFSGILLNARDGNSTLSATVTGNTVKEPGTFASNGIHLNAGTVATDTCFVCIDIRNNNIAGSGASGGTDFRLRQRQSTTVRLPGYAGGATDTAAVISFVQGNNPGAATGTATVNSPPGGGFLGGAACALP